VGRPGGLRHPRRLADIADQVGIPLQDARRIATSIIPVREKNLDDACTKVLAYPLDDEPLIPPAPRTVIPATTAATRPTATTAAPPATATGPGLAAPARRRRLRPRHLHPLHRPHPDPTPTAQGTTIMNRFCWVTLRHGDTETPEDDQPCRPSARPPTAPAAG
jgi:hypothetical protein